MKVRELLTTEDKWTKDAFARRKDGKKTSVIDCEAVQWCLTGAIEKCYYRPEWENIVKIREITEKVVRFLRMEIPDWNDKPERTFLEVRRVIEKLDI